TARLRVALLGLLQRVSSGSLHEQIWLCRPPGFTGTFPPGTQWQLRRPVYGLRHAPREWHDLLRTTLADFFPSSANPSLFVCRGSTPFFVLVYVDDLILTRFRFPFSKVQPTPLAVDHGLTAPPLDEPFESSGPYPELVGCLMYLMTCYSDSSWADDAESLRSTQGYCFGLGAGAVSWRSIRASSVSSSNCEAELYAAAMAAQELRWLSFLLTDLGERPRSLPVLFADNRSAILLCGKPCLVGKAKHIQLRYFLLREFQQRGQAHVVCVVSEANTADIFTKALPPCAHQRCCTQLGLESTGPHLLA
ncbi:unnamed protein product, partial [Closterium sp. NIES-53]